MGQTASAPCLIKIMKSSRTDEMHFRFELFSHKNMQRIVPRSLGRSFSTSIAGREQMSWDEKPVRKLRKKNVPGPSPPPNAQELLRMAQRRVDRAERLERKDITAQLTPTKTCTLLPFQSCAPSVLTLPLGYSQTWEDSLNPDISHSSIRWTRRGKKRILTQFEWETREFGLRQKPTNPISSISALLVIPYAGDTVAPLVERSFQVSVKNQNSRRG